MESVVAQDLELAPTLLYWVFFFVGLPIGLCIIAGFARTRDKSGVSRGALCGVLAAIASLMGFAFIDEFITIGDLDPLTFQALVTAGMGAVVTYWAVRLEFWNN